MNRWQVLVVALGFSLVSCTTSLPAKQPFASIAKAGECVALMHGLARSSSSMKKMRVALLAHGYLVVSENYPSRRYTVKQLSETAVPSAIAQCRAQGANKIHFVTHSMGGILVRQYLANSQVAEFARFVMLAPPNKGSQVIDKLMGLPGFAWFMGPAGLELGTIDPAVPATLGPVNVDTAVIAGTKSINLLLSLLLPNPDDGKVSVANTKVAGMCAHLSLPIAHPFIMKDARVITEVLSYISTGTFGSERANYFDCSASANNRVDVRGDVNLR